MDAIKDMDNDKSPGLDGIPAEFYKTFVNKLAPFFIRNFNEILKKMGREIKTGAITLISKEISLLCTDYKLIAKIITNRLKKVKAICLNPYQTGALPMRSIETNLCTIRTVILDSPSTIPGAIIVLDFQKAYDMVDRSVLYRVLTGFGFSATFVNLIRTLYEDSFARIILNGEVGEEIDMSRGLKQGGPLAAILYLLCIEPLHLKISNTIK